MRAHRPVLSSGHVLPPTPSALGQLLYPSRQSSHCSVDLLSKSALLPAALGFRTSNYGLQTRILPQSFAKLLDCPKPSVQWALFPCSSSVTNSSCPALEQLLDEKLFCCQGFKQLLPSYFLASDGGGVEHCSGDPWGRCDCAGQSTHRRGHPGHEDCFL